MSAVLSLSGGKRTWRLRAPTSEFDPWATYKADRRFRSGSWKFDAVACEAEACRSSRWKSRTAACGKHYPAGAAADIDRLPIRFVYWAVSAYTDISARASAIQNQRCCSVRKARQLSSTPGRCMYFATLWKPSFSSS